jgi:hypothetical protein
MYSRLRFASSLLILTALSSAAFAQTKPQFAVGTKITVNPEIAATAGEQLKRARQKIYALKRIEDTRERMTAALDAMSNLAVIPQRWPHETDAVLESYLLQGELALGQSMPRNAVDALKAALPKSSKTRYYVPVEQKLALAHERLGDAAAAEAHLLAAERSPEFRNHPHAPTVLQQLGMLYSRTNRPREAMNRFRAAADLPGQAREGARASYLIAALKEAVRLSDDPDRAAAKATARDAERALAQARRGKQDSRTLSGADDDLMDLKKKFGL